MTLLEKLKQLARDGKLLLVFRRETVFMAGRIGRRILSAVLPVKQNKVVLQAFDDHYMCNIKYICEELRKRNAGLDLVYVIRNGDRNEIPEDVRVAERGSFRYYREILSARVVVINSILFGFNEFHLKKGQTLIETWHGSLGIKRIGKNDNNLGWHWTRSATMTGQRTDYCISNSMFENGIYRETYWPKAEILMYGHPRNDILAEADGTRRAAVRKKVCAFYGVPEDTKFVLYAPTFRKDKNFDCYTFDIEGMLQAAKERFGGEHWKLLLRYHPSLREDVKQAGNLPSGENVLDATNWSDMQELISAADIGITDYSSWMFDYMLMGRPVFVFATDIEKYNTERGFYYPLESTPFPIATTPDRLLENIRAFDDRNYDQRLKDFLKDKGCIEDGHASERVADLILKLTGVGERA